MRNQIRKSFALNVLLATALLAGCSSNSTAASPATDTSSAGSSAGGSSSAGSTAPASSSKAASSSSSGSGSGSGSAPGSAAGAPSSPADCLKLAYAGVTGSLPTEAVKAQPGVNFWVVSCGEAVATCSSTAGGAMEAAKKLGWQAHLCDGRLNPAGWSSCIRQAVAAKAAVVDVIGTDCPPIKQALTEAKAAGVKTVAGGGFDCSELGDKQVFDGTIKYLAEMTNHEWWAALGKFQADWVIGATDGKAQVLSLNFTDEAWGADVQNAFVKELATCSGCAVVKTLEVANADLISGSLRAKFSTALLQTAGATAINLPIDGWFPAGLAQAITSSGRSDKLSVIGGIGEVPNMGYIRSNGGQDASAAFASVQSGWSGVDVAARLLAGQTAPEGMFAEGVGIQVVDKTTNLPPAGQSYVPPVDFRAGYAKVWGVG